MGGSLAGFRQLALGWTGATAEDGAVRCAHQRDGTAACGRPMRGDSGFGAQFGGYRYMYLCPVGHTAYLRLDEEGRPVALCETHHEDMPCLSCADPQMPRDGLRRGAVMDGTRRYRYHLWREWASPARARVLFVLLNPSVADGHRDDATTLKCLTYARRWGYDAMDIANLFAYRATHPEEIVALADPVGLENDRWLDDLAGRAQRVVLGWGAWGRLRDRGRVIGERLARWNPTCLGITGVGQPCHPLYLPGNRDPKAFDWTRITDLKRRGKARRERARNAGGAA